MTPDELLTMCATCGRVLGSGLLCVRKGRRRAEYRRVLAALHATAEAEWPHPPAMRRAMLRTYREAIDRVLGHG